jgi:hypothetical protein
MTEGALKAATMVWRDQLSSRSLELTVVRSLVGSTALGRVLRSSSFNEIVDRTQPKLSVTASSREMPGAKLNSLLES